MGKSERPYNTKGFCSTITLVDHLQSSGSGITVALRKELHKSHKTGNHTSITQNQIVEGN